MEADRALARLEAYQSHVLRIIAEARPLLGDRDASQFKAMALARWQLLRVLREYQLFKHGEIFDPIIASGPSLKTLAAGHLKRRCVAIAKEFNAHVQRWSLAGASGEWESYRAEAVTMSERIERNLGRELRDIRALLTGMKQTRSFGLENARYFPVQVHA